ncbi:MAG: MFS transporter [Gammaproteobacteria bacterium]|nr:MFS transporter [Gammaproteobacteria bacterium]
MAEQQSQARLSLLAIFMFLLAAIFYFYEFLLQVSPSIMSHNLMHDLHINATSLGLLSGAYFISYTAMQLPVGLLYDRFGPRRVLTIATLFCALGAVLFALSPNGYVAAFARFVMGIGSACSFVGMLYVSFRWLPIRYFPLFVGLGQTLGSIGALSGQTMLAALVNQFGWRHTILVFALAVLILSALIGLFLRNHPSRAQRNFTKEPAPGIAETFKQIFRSAQTWVIALYALCVWTPVAIFASLWGVPFLMTRYDISNVAAGKISAMVWVGTAVGSPLGSWISVCMGRRCPPLIGAAAIGLLCSAAVLYFNNLSMQLVAVLLFFMGYAACGQSLSFGVVQDNNYSSVCGTAIGFNNMAVVIGGAFFQPLIGGLLDLQWQGTTLNDVRSYSVSAYHTALIILPLCFLIALIAAQFFIKETYCRKIIKESTRDRSSMAKHLSQH